MRTITTDPKIDGDTFTADEYNELRQAINENAADVWNEVECSMLEATNDILNPPSVSVYGGIYTKQFEADDTVYFTLPIPMDYKEGTNLKPYIKAAFNSAFTEQDYEVEFTIATKVANPSGNFNADFNNNTFLDSFDTVLTTTLYKWYTTEITGTSLEVGGLVMCKLTLNTFAPPDYLSIFSAGFAYQSDGRGSTSYNEK